MYKYKLNTRDYAQTALDLKISNSYLRRQNDPRPFLPLI